MKLEHQAAAVVAEAERKIRDLAAAALNERQYAAVRSLSILAEQLAESSATLANGATVSGVDEGCRSAAPANDAPAAAHLAPGSGFPEPATRHDASNRAKSFPRFFRSGSDLVKIGYSKSDRRTYEHRCPRAVMDRVAAVVAARGADDRQFPTQELVPPQEHRLRDVPSYQLYLCLGFLVRHGLVHRHGRSGYTIESGLERDFLAAVSSAWRTLPVRS